jgi:hypothetical protein
METGQSGLDLDSAQLIQHDTGRKRVRETSVLMVETRALNSAFCSTDSFSQPMKVKLHCSGQQTRRVREKSRQRTRGGGREVKKEEEEGLGIRDGTEGV